MEEASLQDFDIGESGVVVCDISIFQYFLLEEGLFSDRISALGEALVLGVDGIHFVKF